MRIDYDGIGAIGVITDTPADELPQNAWSDSRNMRFQNGVAIKFTGSEDALSATASISISPMFVVSVATPAATMWAYASDTAVYGTDGTTHIDISDGAYSATADWNWTGSIFGGFAILNNGVNCPRQWGDSSAGPSLSKVLKPLENWSVTASTTCRFIRPFKNYLIAGDITEANVRKPRLIHWSHPAAYGTVPSSWDYGDTTKDAGRYELAETEDFCVDGAKLNDVFVIYKENTVWGMQYIGPPNIFRFFNIFEDRGILSRRCMAPFNGNHAVFGRNDVYIHNGQVPTPIFTSRIKDWIYNQIDSTYFVRSFVTANPAQDEIWFCFPGSGQTMPNYAAVWNHRHNTTQIRDLDSIAHIHNGAIPTSNSIWASDSETWASDSTAWDYLPFNNARQQLIGVKPSTKKIYAFDQTTSNDGSAFEAYVTRLGLPIGRQSSTGEIKPDVTKYKNVYTIYPRITGTVGGVVNVYVGQQSVHGGAVTWSSAYPYTIGTDYKVDVRVSGKLLGIKFASTTAISWTLQGFSLDVNLEGDR